MDDHRQESKSDPRALSRRALFGRTLAIAGGAVAVLGLTGCPGGDQDDDDDDEGDDD
jgi:hypothetical protein